jgi:hypothetical protein
VPLPFSQVASPNIGLVEGVYYCNHGFPMLVGANQGAMTFHGTVVSHDEAIVSYAPINFVYDSRINSRYHNNPNSFISLNLPYSPNVLQVNQFQELTPDATPILCPTSVSAN